MSDDGSSELLPANAPLEAPSVRGSGDDGIHTGAEAASEERSEPEPASLRDRSIAGLIDLVPVTLLFFGMAERQRSNVELEGAHFVLFVVMWLAYYFASEALTGTTLGKAVLSLHVQGPDGVKPSLVALAVRNALRVVDGLPVLYLVGLLTAAFSDGRRRIGDLAAKTQVCRRQGSDIRGREFAVLVMLAVLLGGFGMAGIVEDDGPEVQLVNFDTLDLPEFDFADERVQPIVDASLDAIFEGSPNELLELMPDGVSTIAEIRSFQSQLTTQFGTPAGEYVEMSAITLPAASIPSLSDEPVPVRQLVYATSFSRRPEVAVRLEIVQLDGELLLLGFNVFEPTGS